MPLFHKAFKFFSWNGHEETKKKKKGLILDYEHCCRWQELGGNKICGKRRNAEMTRKPWCSWEKGAEGR